MKLKKQRMLDNMRKQIRVLSDQLEWLAKLTVKEWESGPESSREEMVPALSGGDKSTMRLAAA